MGARRDLKPQRSRPRPRGRIFPFTPRSDRRKSPFKSKGGGNVEWLRLLAPGAVNAHLVVYRLRDRCPYLDKLRRLAYIKGEMKTNKALAYIRVSTEEQAVHGLSIPAQKEALESYARLRGLEIAEFIVDAGISGGKPLGARPGGRKLLGLLAEGKASHIVALRLDRLFRDAADCLATVEAWTKRGLVLHLLDVGGNSIDTSSAAGKFMLTILAAVAEMERNLIAERIRNVLGWKRRNGKVFGHEPFGFARDGDDLVPVEAEQRALELIVDLRARGYSLRKIAKTLEARGIPTKRGGRWAAATVRKLIARAEEGSLCLAKS